MNALTLTKGQDRAVSVSGGTNSPWGHPVLLPAMTLGFTEMFLSSVKQPVDLRGGLKPAPPFPTSEIIDFFTAPLPAVYWGAVPRILSRASFFVQILHQVLHDLFKRFHSFQNSIFFADHYSEEGSRDVGQVDRTIQKGARHD